MTKSKVITRERSAKTGQFVPTGTEKKKPNQTIIDKMKVEPKKKKP